MVIAVACLPVSASTVLFGQCSLPANTSIALEYQSMSVFQELEY